MLMLCLNLALASLLQTPQTLPQTPTPPPAPKPAVLEIRVTDRTGLLLEGAHVSAEGTTSREGKTDASGSLSFRTIPPGTYRFRIERDGYFTLEKEVTVTATKTTAVEAALSPAPAPPPPPKPAAPVVVAPPPLVAGDPRTVSIPDFAEAQVLGKLTNRESPIGCSGATAARLIQTKDPIAAHTHADADETLYVVAGEATVKMNGKEQALEPGWFVIVPRGTEHSIGRKGKGPVAFLSTLSGPPCADKIK